MKDGDKLLKVLEGHAAKMVDTIVRVGFRMVRNTGLRNF